MFLQWMLVVVMPLLTAACGRRRANECDCIISPDKSHACLISIAAPQGFKCACDVSYSTSRHPLAATSKCEGEAIPCRNDEACPGGRYSYCACVQGGGNCLGYNLRPSTVGSCPKVNKVEASSSLRQYSYKSCDCEYSSDNNNWGCRIGKAAPEGFKCFCRYCGSYSCCAQSQGCDEDEYCPADDYTYCGCLRGGGNCDGYPIGDRDQVCDLGSTCSCDRRSDWTSGRYSVEKVTFDTGQISRSIPRPVSIGHVLDNPNASEMQQRQVVTFVNNVASESSFEHTFGISLNLGITFTATLPINGGLSSTYSYKFGEKTTSFNQTSHSYWCDSPRKTHTLCTSNLMMTDVTVPYTMLLKHAVIPDCVCPSYGNWRSTTSYYSQMRAIHIGPCHRLDDSGECVTTE